MGEHTSASRRIRQCLRIAGQEEDRVRRSEKSDDMNESREEELSVREGALGE